MSQRFITPSKITAWLEYPHYLALDGQVAAGTLIRPRSVTGSYAEMSRDKGDVHERACLAALNADGKRIREMPIRGDGETFAAFVDRVGNPFGDDNTRARDVDAIRLISTLNAIVEYAQRQTTEFLGGSR